MDRTELTQRLVAYMEGKLNLSDYVVQAVIRQREQDAG